MRRFFTMLAVAAGVLVSSAPSVDARMHDPEKLPVTRIRDLHYGDVLFYLYQGDDLTAASRLLAYQQWERIPHHQAEGQLLLGGLYLSLGLHNEAGELFQKLLTDDVPTGVRNRAWFYLAEVWYERGYLDRADESLRKINGRMSPELEAQKEHLFSNVLIREGKLNEAIALLAHARGEEVWYAYARFNLGVALVRSKRVADADAFLTAVGTMPAATSELQALKDRANLALGYAYLQGSNPKRARQAFERVRLDGPFSNKALLGTGYADAALGNFERALTPWTVLRGRNVLDSAVQESYVALPYAYGKLGANDQSAEFYETALSSLGDENGKIDQAIDRIRGGQLLDAVLTGDHEGNAHDWYWQLKSVPNAPESRYLYTVLAGYDFQVGLRTYRDLSYMDDTLAHWDDSMEAFQSMIDTREQAYHERLPVADTLLESDSLEKVRQHRQDLHERLDGIVRDHDVAALGSPEEQAQWERVQRDEAALAQQPQDDADTAESAQKLHLIKGVLYFRLNEAFNARLWQQQRTLKELDSALAEAQSRWIRVERARKEVPANTGEFEKKVAALKERISGVRVRLAAVQQRQKAYLAQLAIGELGQQKDRLATYQVQARFALANMYDRAATAASDAPGDEEGSGGEPGTLPPQASAQKAEPRR